MVYSDWVEVIDFVDFKKIFISIFSPVGCLHCLHIKNLTKKDWKEHESAQKDNREALYQTEAAWGARRGPPTLGTAACSASAVSQSPSPPLPHRSLEKKRASFLFKSCLLSIPNNPGSQYSFKIHNQAYLPTVVPSEHTATPSLKRCKQCSVSFTMNGHRRQS